MRRAHQSGDTLGEAIAAQSVVQFCLFEKSVSSVSQTWSDLGIVTYSSYIQDSSVQTRKKYLLLIVMRDITAKGSSSQSIPSL